MKLQGLLIEHISNQEMEKIIFSEHPHYGRVMPYRFKFINIDRQYFKEDRNEYSCHFHVRERPSDDMNFISNSKTEGFIVIWSKDLLNLVNFITKTLKEFRKTKPINLDDVMKKLNDKVDNITFIVDTEHAFIVK